MHLTLGILRKSQAVSYALAFFWLDGFAEMTPQELDLLAALVPMTERSTLAFCLDRSPRESPRWRSSWAGVTETFAQCEQRVAAIAGVQIHCEELSLDPVRSRFNGQPALWHLARHWDEPRPYSGDEPASNALRLRALVVCLAAALIVLGTLLTRR